MTQAVLRNMRELFSDVIRGRGERFDSTNIKKKNKPFKVACIIKFSFHYISFILYDLFKCLRYYSDALYIYIYIKI